MKADPALYPPEPALRVTWPDGTQTGPTPLTANSVWTVTRGQAPTPAP